MARVKELEREDKERAQEATFAELQQFVAEKRRAHEEHIMRERAKGHNVPRVPEFRGAIFDGQRAIVRYGMNGEIGRMDIFYGGCTPDPMDKKNGHGHIIVRHGSVE